MITLKYTDDDDDDFTLTVFSVCIKQKMMSEFLI